VEVEDLTEEYARFHFLNDVLDGEQLTPYVQGVDPADQKVLLEGRYLHCG